MHWIVSWQLLDTGRDRWCRKWPSRCTGVYICSMCVFMGNIILIFSVCLRCLHFYSRCVSFCLFAFICFQTNQESTEKSYSDTRIYVRYVYPSPRKAPSSRGRIVNGLTNTTCKTRVRTPGKAKDTCAVYIVVLQEFGYQ